MFRRIFCTLLVLLLALSLLTSLTSCTEKSDDGKLRIVCSLFPQYDWLRNIIGESDSVELILLIDNGSDIHSYEPTAADILTISECDMIVYLDDEVDNWVSEALERADREDIKKIALSECEGVIKHDISSTSHTHDGEEHHHSHDEHDHKTFDEHLWLSIKNAVQISEALCDALCQLDPSGEENYRSNTAKYLEQLGQLDEEYKNAVSHVDAEDRFMMFCDRFPFVYLLEDYGIEYAAAFEGCSTDVDADFDTVLRLIEEVESHGVDFVMVTESTDGALAETVTNSVKGREVGVLCMDSMQAVSRKQIESGKTYLSVMEENLRVLKIALGAQD